MLPYCGLLYQNTLRFFRFITCNTVYELVYIFAYWQCVCMKIFVQFAFNLYHLHGHGL